MDLFARQRALIDIRLGLLEMHIRRKQEELALVYNARGDRGHLAHNWTLGPNPVLEGEKFEAAKRVLRYQAHLLKAYRAAGNMKKGLR